MADGHWKSARDKDSSGWREYLTAEEAKEIAAADAAREKIVTAQRKWEERYGRSRYKIQNRAIQRAKYARGQR